MTATTETPMPGPSPRTRANRTFALRFTGGVLLYFAALLLAGLA